MARTTIQRAHLRRVEIDRGSKEFQFQTLMCCLMVPSPYTFKLNRSYRSSFGMHKRMSDHRLVYLNFRPTLPGGQWQLRLQLSRVVCTDVY